MPYITIEMFEGRTIEQKRELAEVLTREVARICKTDPTAVQIKMYDLLKTNIAKGGQLESDK